MGWVLGLSEDGGWCRGLNSEVTISRQHYNKRELKECISNCSKMGAN